MSKYFSILLFSIFIKFTYVLLIASILDLKNNNKLEKFLGAWCIVEIIFIFYALILSFFKILSPSFFLLVILMSIILLLIYKERNRFEFYLDNNIIPDQPIVIFLYLMVFCFFVFLLYRSCFYYDNTWDALTYEMTRILMYSSYKSILVSQPTLEFNIFSNEWNGELNSLFYILFTDNDQGMSFGNLEVLLIYFCSIVWFVSLFGLNKISQLIIGLVFITAPIIMGLSITLKGDLLAITAYILALGFSWKSFKTKEIYDYNFFYALTSLGLGVGAKLILLPGGAILAIGLIYDYLLKKKNLSFLLGTLFLFSLGNLRYILNLFTYQEPFKHVEASNFSINYLRDNLLGILDMMTNLRLIGNTWVLNVGFGYAGIVIILLIVFNCYTIMLKRDFKKFKPTYSNCILLSSVTIGFFYILIAIPWYPWSLRYFLIYLNPIFLVILVYFLKQVSDLKCRYISIIIPIIFFYIAIVNFIDFFKNYGENNPQPIEVIMNNSELERKLAFHPYFLDPSMGLSKNEIKNKSFVLVNQLDSLAAIYFGEHHDNKVLFVEHADNLDSFFEEFDFVVFTGYGDPENEKISQIKTQKYHLKFRDKYRVIFERNNDENDDFQILN